MGFKLHCCFHRRAARYREDFVNIVGFFAETILRGRESNKKLNTYQRDLCPNVHFSPPCPFQSVVLFYWGAIYS